MIILDAAADEYVQELQLLILRELSANNIKPDTFYQDPNLVPGVACYAYFKSDKDSRAVTMLLRADRTQLVTLQSDDGPPIGPMQIGGPIESVAEKIARSIMKLLAGEREAADQTKATR